VWKTTELREKRYGGERDSSRPFRKPSSLRVALLSALRCVWPSDRRVVDYTAGGCAVDGHEATLMELMSASESEPSRRVIDHEHGRRIREAVRKRV
jgi:hypothetical protein